MWTLAKAWDADLCLSARAAESARIADRALIEKRVRAALPPGALTPRELRDAALGRLPHAQQVIRFFRSVRTVSRPYLKVERTRALADNSGAPKWPLWGKGLNRSRGNWWREEEFGE
jgi:hypothetical protein